MKIEIVVYVSSNDHAAQHLKVFVKRRDTAETCLNLFSSNLKGCVISTLCKTGCNVGSVFFAAAHQSNVICWPFLRFCHTDTGQTQHYGKEQCTHEYLLCFTVQGVQLVKIMCSTFENARRPFHPPPRFQGNLQVAGQR